MKILKYKPTTDQIIHISSAEEIWNLLTNTQEGKNSWLIAICERNIPRFVCANTVTKELFLHSSPTSIEIINIQTMFRKFDIYMIDHDQMTHLVDLTAH